MSNVPRETLDADEVLGEEVDGSVKGSGKMGRPPIEFKAEHVLTAGQMSDDGATLPEIAAALGVSLKTLERWRGAYPDLRRAIKAGGAAADERVKRSLFERATGYSYAAVEVFNYRGLVVRAKVVKHVPPDTVACIFWLKNRDPAAWKDVQRHEHDVAKVVDAVKERLESGRKRLALVA